MGREALLVELSGIPAVLRLQAAVQASRDTGAEPWPAVAELVPGARTLLVVTRPGADVDALARALVALADDDQSDGGGVGGAGAGPETADAAVGSAGEPGGTGDVVGDAFRGVPGAGSARTVEVPATYDGADLDEVAALTGLDPDAVVAAHTGTPWTVAFGGFAPGFAYLVGGDERLRVPRRPEPRTAVPAGSVGLAGEFSGIYPSASPGGWQLIGRTDVVLWDLDRDPPALFRPGDWVRFVARPPSTEPENLQPGLAKVGGEAPGGDFPQPRLAKGAGEAPDGDFSQPRLEEVAGEATDGDFSQPRWAERALEVLATGPLTLVEDLGRPGHAAVGVSRSGAADRAAHALGARLVGQSPGRAGLEVTLGGLRVRAHGLLTVAVTGAPAPCDVDGRPAPHAAPITLSDGQVLTLGMPLTGLRSYLTVRGGIDVRPVLGSRSSDVLSGIGPPVVAAGDRLPVGEPPAAFPTVDAAPYERPETDDVVLTLDPGPRLDWIAERGQLTDAVWHVSSRSNRIGIRLQGNRIQRHPSVEGRELPTEGLTRGAVQVPPGGEPVLFLGDHPATGGYPVAAVVRPADVDRAAQLRPGQRLRLRWA